MAKRAMAAWKVMAMVLLVVLPGGSVVLLAMALYRAYRKRSGPFSPGFRLELKRHLGAPFVAMARLARMPFAHARA